MSPRDAFGNETGEDSLAALGWKEGMGARGAVGRAEQIVVQPQPTEPSTGMGLPDASSSRMQIPGSRGRGLGAGTVLAAVVVATVIGVGAAVVGFISDAVDDFDVPDVTTPSFTPTTPSDPPGTSPRPAATPAGLERGSLLLASNLSPALRRLRLRVGGTVRYVRVSAERVDVGLIDSRNRLVTGQVRSDGKLQVFSRTPAPAPLLENGIPWPAVDARAPTRIARSAAGRTRRPVSQFDYAVLIAGGGARQWSAFMKGGDAFLASPDGRSLQRNG